MNKLTSRRFWMGLAGLVIPYVAKALSREVTWTQAIAASTISIVSYITGESATDIARARKQE